jgi:Fe-Mn family superoxide dismutase
VAQNGIFNNISPALEPQPVLGNDGPGHRRHAGRAGKGHHRELRLGRRVQIEFSAAGAGSSARAGAGWSRTPTAALKVTKTENGVNPLCFGQTALLGCDVWEHSYYIDFRNKRPAYLTNFLDNLVNWENVASRM